MLTRLLLSGLAVTLFLSSCTAPTAADLALRDSLAWPSDTVWQNSAQRIQTGEYTILYHGTAVPAPAPHSRHPWTGSITGEILVRSPRATVTIPQGTLTVGPNHEFRVSGASRTSIVDAPASSR